MASRLPRETAVECPHRHVSSGVGPCMNLTKVINEAVESIKLSEEKRKKNSNSLNFLRKKNLLEFNSSELLEEKFISEVKKTNLNSRIAGIDSGFIGKSFSSIDLILVRAMAAVFDFKNSKVVSSNYFPNFFKFPEPIILTNALERDEFNCSKSLYRLQKEINLAREVIKEFSPEFVFLDGSIIPMHADKPRNDSKITALYHEVLNDFQELFQASEKSKCKLIACVEDSRGTRFKGIIQKEVLPKTQLLSSEAIENSFDSSLLDYLLKQGERSFAFRYASNVKQHPILNDLDSKWSERIHAFYLKPSQFDRPLRVEFIAEAASMADKGQSTELGEQVNEIASIVFALSSFHREYAFPTVLIEADLRAKLKPEEIDIVFEKILDKAGSHLFMPQRRDKRPF